MPLKNCALAEVSPHTKVKQTENNRAEVMINASWVLGENIVRGTVTPDRLIVHKPYLAVISRTIADKQRMTVSALGGTREVEVPRFLRAQASLNDEQVIEVAKLALTLEGTMEHPVDVECAYAQIESLHSPLDPQSCAPR